MTKKPKLESEKDTEIQEKFLFFKNHTSQHPPVVTLWLVIFYVRFIINTLLASKQQKSFELSQRQWSDCVPEVTFSLCPYHLGSDATN